MRNISLFSSLVIESHRWAQCRLCNGGAARVEETGELGRWSRERPSRGPAAVRRRRGAAGMVVAESVPVGAGGDVGAAAEVLMAGFLLLLALFVAVVLCLWGARGGKGSAGNSRGVRGFGVQSSFGGIGRAMVRFILAFSLCNWLLGGKILFFGWFMCTGNRTQYCEVSCFRTIIR